MKTIIIAGLFFYMIQTNAPAASCEKSASKKLSADVGKVVSRLPASEIQELTIDIKTSVTSHFNHKIINCCLESSLDCKIKYNPSRGGYNLFQFITHGTKNQHFHALECIKHIKELDRIEENANMDFWSFKTDLAMVIDTFK